jgi:hypothetical protein
MLQRDCRPFYCGRVMFDKETSLLLRSVLDEVCEQVSKYENGTRTYVASNLLEAAGGGGQTRDDLRNAGREALRSAPTMWR